MTRKKCLLSFIDRLEVLDEYYALHEVHTGSSTVVADRREADCVMDSGLMVNFCD